ncbi:MAG TPA: polysaccharide deacetylase family protein, partial [Bacillota bacterium]|nr:polysaccharide deacetylase family protein [Bacillota bacterium]
MNTYYPDNSIKPTTGMLDHTGDYYIGRAAHTSAFYFKGTIGYIAVYNRKLTDAETLSVQTAIHNEIAARGIPITRNVRPMIVITIDDNFETDYTNAYRLASARGIPLTLYIITTNVGKPGFLTWNQIHKLRAAGFGVECHHHSQTPITTQSEAELRASMEAVDAAFIAAGLPIPEHYAFPGGQSDATRRAIIADYRDTGRNIVRHTIPAITGWGQTIDWHNINSQHSMTEKQGDSIDHIKAKIDHAIQHNHVLIIYTHDISDNPTGYGCYVGNFEELLDYVAAKRDAGLIDPVTIDGLYRAMQGIRTHPATGSKTLQGEVTGATYDKTVDYVGFVW